MKNMCLKENITHGTAEMPVDALHFEMGEGREYPKGIFVPNHWHDYVEYIIIREGRYRLMVNLEEIFLEPGDLCIFNSGDLHQLENIDLQASHDAFLFHPEILTFAYPDQWTKDILSPVANHHILSKNVVHNGEYVDTILRKQFDELFSIVYGEEAYWYERCKVKLLEIQISLQSQGYLSKKEEQSEGKEQKQIARYKRLISYMEEHYAEPLSLEDLAGLIPCNSQYLCRFFKKISGVTPIRYLIEYRLEQSLSMLLEEDKSITQIALDCGFDNISYYIRQFKQKYGMTPGEYKNARKSYE